VSNARTDMLARIGRAEAPPTDTAGTVVALPAPQPWQELAEAFQKRARAASATVEIVASLGAVPVSVARYLTGQGLPLRVHAGGLLPEQLVLDGGGALALAHAALADDGECLVTGCLAAVAEEGAVALATGGDSAAESAFLAQTHIVVVMPGQLVSSLEDLWRQVRGGGRHRPARMYNLVLGPSRTADLGVPSRLGAHGPLRLHIILVSPGL